MKKKEETEIDGLSEWNNEKDILTRYKKHKIIDQKSKVLNEKIANMEINLDLFLLELLFKEFFES